MKAYERDLPVFRGLAGEPCAEIRIFGRTGRGIDDFPVKVIIDTGLSAFLLIPRTRAEQLGLSPVASTNLLVADGSSSPTPMAHVKVRLRCDDAECQTGDCLLTKSKVALAGIPFLKAFRLTLTIGPERLSLTQDRAGP